ncbi:MAG: hypothetical protein FWE15_23190, partial [Actinomycetia bacterium]|nr:hypothetical protein [Actinomycetes bacterium]
VVGPMVLPGRTACGECVGLRLARRDPAWPRMLAQLRSGRQPAVPACDIALATAVAGLAAAHVLAHLDGRTPPSAGARAELSLDRLSERIRPLPAETGCGCGAAARAARTGAAPGHGEDRTPDGLAPGPARSPAVVARSTARSTAGPGRDPVREPAGGRVCHPVQGAVRIPDRGAGPDDRDIAPPVAASGGLLSWAAGERGTMAM